MQIVQGSSCTRVVTPVSVALGIHPPVCPTSSLRMRGVIRVPDAVYKSSLFFFLFSNPFTFLLTATRVCEVFPAARLQQCMKHVVCGVEKHHLHSSDAICLTGGALTTLPKI